MRKKQAEPNKPSTSTRSRSGARSFAEERQSAIVEMLERNTSIQVNDIAQAFGVSAVTARADLDALAADGKLRRTHGGAVSLHKTLTVSVQDKRVNLNAQEKRRVGLAAQALVEDASTIMVDSGTTALEFVRALGKRSGITIITADLTIANFVDASLPDINCVLLGGTLRKGHRYTYGPLTVRSLDVLHADLAIICPGSFVPSRGLMTDYPQMADVKAAMIAAADTSCALMDASKVGAGGLIRFAGLEDLDAIVVDRDPAGIVGGMAESLGEQAPQLIIAP
ncbi:DeoR/GlpR family DNA-binding transcription regulator [Collinsella sp. AGMB00827]|uniref:DeoR/GlpR family DNA-binding transcription regulator n=1 Tax=Collinsella ureilytica TaxID=2869515 RepID=A0ABS7MJG5_9ACTN|nr:DeoR/GlpR family DNA-binding transcription regulator [Collinsella urealyticum]MBY4797458.1 DeoR/GlpR family DNA-binding transcription regulator [Collinsella urealyticum]